MKSNQTLKILFWHRKSKANSNGLAPIICRISIEGMEEEFSTALKVLIDSWDVETKTVTKSKNSKKINTIIANIENTLEIHFTVLKTQYEYVTPLMLKNAYQNLPIESKKGTVRQTKNEIPKLLELTEIHIKDFSELVDKNLRSKETLKQWKATRKKLSEFLKFEFEIVDLNLSDIEYSFAQKFYRYLAVKRTPILKDAAAMKQIKNLKQVLNVAEARKWLLKNPIEKFRCGSEEPEIIPLEVFEVEKIWRKKISIEHP